ncbi:Ff.00g083160.m01.CDS01 [Fusarium sp. VM40]|nr:Ff.00g083160.m01.CDS01 [Fusarium sp. VM40]
MSLKDRISSPLEAGTSILDAHHLPPHLAPALEHVSSRLARKSQHITLVVARRDYQLPSVVPPKGLLTPTTPSPLSPGLRFNFHQGPVSRLRSLVRIGSSASLRSMDSPRSAISSPGQVPPLEVSSPRLRWPLSPSTPLSPPPMTPCTGSSTTTDTMSSMMSASSGFGMRLIHTNELHPRSEKILNSVLVKTEKKFSTGPEWLAPAARPASCGLTNQLIHSSIIQNEVLFCSEGLTILSLDRLYSLKSALSSYSKTKSHLRLEDAVDELRRIILATNGAKVSKTAILRSYDWLSVSSSALVDLDRMYRRAYGGPEQYGGISGLTSFAEPAIQPISDSQERYKEDEVEESTIAVAVMKGKTPSPKPLLKLQTNFTPGPILKPKPKKPEASAQVPIQVRVEEEEEEDGDRTARPTDQLYFSIQKWEPPSTIDQVLTAGPINRSAFSPLTPTPIMSPGSTRFGPLTPHDYEDISPTTRGEWGFMLADNAFQSGRKVGVETF